MADHSVSHLSLKVSVLTVKPCIYFYMLLIWSSCYNTSVTGQYQVFGSQDILVKVGDEVILPCLIKPPFNMNRKTVEWSRPDLDPYLIHLLQDGHYKHDQDLNLLYKERTSLFPDQLPIGNMSLKLSKVKLSDEGTFRCSAPQLHIYTLIKLLVAGAMSQPVTSSNGPTDGGVSLSCDSGCWYREPEMSWLDGNGTLLPAGPSVTETRPPNCYIVQRNVTVRTAGHVTCRVHLPHINRTLKTGHDISERDFPTEGGSAGAVIAVIITLIIILVAAVLGYLYWKKKKHPDVKVTRDVEEMAPLVNQADQPMMYSDRITNDEEIRIVMVGKTGAGKSATGNTILGPDAPENFKSKFSPKSVTLSCNKASGVVAGRMVSVIDTPGLFDTGFTMARTLEEVRNCITCAAPGPHVFLAVIKLGRYTEEEKNVVAKIQKEFGQSSDKYTMILFTHGDDLKGQTIEKEFLNDKLRNLISKYNGRYHVFNNESKDPSQVTELLEKITQMVEENGGSHYTNQMFQEEARKQALLVKTSGRLITDYEDMLQDNMDKTYLSVKLGTEPEIMFENNYTPLYNADINVTDIHSHHEVRQMEMKKAGEEKEIQLSDIFKDPSGRNKRTVLTVGCAGIGKTFLVHKLISDWAKKYFPQGPHLIFPLKFRQLNLLKGQNFSLSKLIHTCIEETRIIEEDVLNEIFNKLQKSEDYNKSPFKVQFVMADLDKSDFQLDFSKNVGSMNVTDPYPLEVLLVHLIKGELLPSAQIWITSRPAAANQIPKEFVNRMTEVRGFITDEQKKEFFMKTFSDENQASSIYSHIKESRILHTMCEIPAFCWSLATVVQNMGMTDKLPNTLTDMCCYFLMGETQRERMKNPALDEADKEKVTKDAGEVLLKLGRLAFDQLDKGNIIFYKKDLEESGLDVNKDLLNSGLCTTFFKEDDVFFLQTVYCFVHLSIQEFLAAVYLFHCFTQKNMEVLKTFLEDDDYNSDSSMSDFLKAAMKKTLQSESGHLDLFVRFLHGLSLESNQSLLGGLLGQTEKSPEEIQRAINNLKEMNGHKISPDRCVNILHCLTEMNDRSVHQEIQQYLESEDRSVSQCSALASMLLKSEEVLDELDLQKYNTSNDGRPAVRNSTAARLNEEQQTSQRVEREEEGTDRPESPHTKGQQ